MAGHPGRGHSVAQGPLGARVGSPARVLRLAGLEWTVRRTPATSATEARGADHGRAPALSAAAPARGELHRSVRGGLPGPPRRAAECPQETAYGEATIRPCPPDEPSPEPLRLTDMADYPPG